MYPFSVSFSVFFQSDNIVVYIVHKSIFKLHLYCIYYILRSVMWLTTYDILKLDSNMPVSVRPSLFVVESQCMEHLVLDDILENTALAI